MPSPRPRLRMEPMNDFFEWLRRMQRRVAIGVAAPLLFSPGGSTWAAPPPSQALPPAATITSGSFGVPLQPATPPAQALPPAAAPVAAPVQVLDLAACRHIA